MKSLKRVNFLVRLGLFAFLAPSLVLSLAGCSALGGNSPTPTPLPQVVSTEQITFQVKKGPIVALRDIQGEVVPTRQDKLYFRASGFVDQINVKDGDMFKKGDILAELQVSDLLDQLQQAQIDLQVAQNNLNSDNLQRAYDIQQSESDAVIAQKQVDLATITLNNSAGSQREIAQINLDIAQEKLKTAQSWLALVQGRVNSDLEQVVQKNQLAVSRLEKQISDRRLIAPYDGVVLHIAVIPGMSVTAYDETVAMVGDPTDLVIQNSIRYPIGKNAGRQFRSLSLHKPGQESDVPGELYSRFYANIDRTRRSVDFEHRNHHVEFHVFFAAKGPPVRSNPRRQPGQAGGCTGS